MSIVTMTAEERDKVVALWDAKKAAEASLSKALMEFAGDEPYDRNRYQSEVRMLYCLGGILRFEIGRRLVVMWEREREESVRTFAQFLETYFPDLPRRRAYEDMRYAVTAAKHPLFRKYAESKGNFSKGLALLESVNDEELQQFEETGEILGLSVDELDRLSVRELKARIRRLEKQKEEAAQQATETLAGEKNRLEKKVEVLEAALAEPGLEEARQIMRQADKHLHDGVQLLRKVPWKLVAADWTARLEALAKLNFLERVCANIEQEIFKVEEPEPPAGGQE